MKFKSEIVTQVSGSIGGTTYSHNKGGMYRRARAIPINPNSFYQQTVRTNLGNLATDWREILTATQRADWEAYALATPLTDKLGDELILSGQQMFNRCNAVRLRAGFPLVADGPTMAGMPMFAPAFVLATIGTPDITITFDNTDSWANETGGGLAIQTSRFREGTINYFKGPYRFDSSIAGAPVPPTSPHSIGQFNAFQQDVANATAGQRLFVRMCAMGADGRISLVQQVWGTVVA